MALPTLTKPVMRSARPLTPPDLVDPSSCVNLTEGEAVHIGSVWVDLVFGANYNDPASFRYRGYRQVTSSASSRRRF
ncbi:cyanobactin biosynthesis system PatB/AcyB/McaB family protein [Bradyrhizobium sp. DOA9]|uniref:cyanobactin biosynthesis system PatB/AcyB/McaB family protein n=1 Tax=Bradyrhizobium sp. DOA9 TaxID=1126627 RepID=UPI0009EDB3CC|nr:cyanobactin biosynthesis system PatB/AcyB/McaB family protein [Bradyrhizobium sp. DOA9]